MGDSQVDHLLSELLGQERHAEEQVWVDHSGALPVLSLHRAIGVVLHGSACLQGSRGLHQLPDVLPDDDNGAQRRGALAGVGPQSGQPTAEEAGAAKGRTSGTADAEQWNPWQGVGTAAEGSNEQKPGAHPP